MQHVLVTGASRGIGFEFTRQYLNHGAHVFAGFRREETAGKLRELAESHSDKLTLVPLDVSVQDSIISSRDIVARETDRLDLLINNAGIGGYARSTGKAEDLGSFDFEDAWVVLRTMAVGPLLMAQEYLDFLKAGEEAKVANVTSGYGSISGNTTRFPYYYSAAKSTLHQFMRSLTADVKPMGISVVLLDPGSVSTDMGGPTAPTTPTQSVSGMVSVIDSLTLEQSGSFISWQGKTMPW